MHPEIDKLYLEPMLLKRNGKPIRQVKLKTPSRYRRFKVLQRNGIDLVSEHPCTFANGDFWRCDDNAIGYKCLNLLTRYIQDVSTDLTGDTEGFFAIDVSFHDTPSNDTILYIGDSGTVNNVLRLEQTNSSTLQVLLKTTSDIYRATVSFTPILNKRYQLLFTADSTGNRLFINGRKQSLTYTSGSASTSGWLSSLSNIDRFLVGAQDLSSDDAGDVIVYSYCYSDRAANDAEGIKFTSDYYSVLRPVSNVTLLIPPTVSPPTTTNYRGFIQNINRLGLR